MILLCAYQYFSRTHCHSTYIAIDYTTFGAKCRFRDHDWVEILKIPHATFSRIGYFPSLFFHQLKILKSIASSYWRIVSSTRISLSTTQPLDIGLNMDRISPLIYPYMHITFGYGYEYWQMWKN